MDGAAAKDPVRPSFWCRTCGEPVRLSGAALWPEYRRAVHAATGQETGPGPGGGAHAAQPTDEDPVLRAAADALEAETGGLFQIIVRFGIPRAEWSKRALGVPPGTAAVHYSAPTLDALRPRLLAAAAAYAPDAAAR